MSHKLLWLSALCLIGGMAAAGRQRSIDDFFRDYGEEWVRLNPNLAAQKPRSKIVSTSARSITPSLRRGRCLWSFWIRKSTGTFAQPPTDMLTRR